jgi:5'-methylthioadenosine phosphorylase
MAKLAVIGGTGVYEAGILQEVEHRTLVTPYGTVDVQSGPMRGPSGRESEVVFLTRHGRGHSLPPHRVNYRANIWALRMLGVERVIGTGAVGSLKLEMRPGDCVLVDQFLDFTHGRAATFFEGEGAGPGAGLGPGSDAGVVHTDMTEPYCPDLRRALREAAAASGVTLHDGGCYACTQGPRFESAAEIRMFRGLGADVVGMTNVPEVVLARELGLCYALVAMVTNHAAGLTGKPLTHAEVVETMRENVRKIRALAWRALDAVPGERECGCGKQVVT